MDRSHRRTSAIWKYFTNVGDYQATCNLCIDNKKLSFRSSLSNLGKHVIRKHPCAMNGLRKLSPTVLGLMRVPMEEKMKNLYSNEPSSTQGVPQSAKSRSSLLQHDYSINRSSLYQGVQLKELEQDIKWESSLPGLQESFLASPRSDVYPPLFRNGCFDECSAFGEYIAHKLRKMDGRTRTIVQNQINSIFFDVDITFYNSMHSPQREQPSPEQWTTVIVDDNFEREEELETGIAEMEKEAANVLVNGLAEES